MPWRPQHVNSDRALIDRLGALGVVFTEARTSCVPHYASISLFHKTAKSFFSTHWARPQTDANLVDPVSQLERQTQWHMPNKAYLRAIALFAPHANERWPCAAILPPHVITWAWSVMVVVWSGLVSHGRIIEFQPSSKADYLEICRSGHVAAPETARTASAPTRKGWCVATKEFFFPVKCGIVSVNVFKFQ